VGSHAVIVVFDVYLIVAIVDVVTAAVATTDVVIAAVTIAAATSPTRC
jgi:hypothetical protein